MKKISFIILTIILSIIISRAFSGEVKNEYTKDINTLSEALYPKEEDYTNFRTFVYRLENIDPNSINGSVKQKVGILIKAIEREIKNPTLPQKGRGCVFHNFYPATEAIKVIYIQIISKMGKEALPFLYEWYKKSDGDLRDYITFAIISSGDKSFINKLWDIAINSKNNYIRAGALISINYHKIYKKEYIPFYKEMLSDPFCVPSCSDVIMSGEYEYMNTTCPIRDAAYAALVKLGIKVKRIKNEYYIEDE